MAAEFPFNLGDGTFVRSDWWRCPNDPPCPHGSTLHDAEDDLEDQAPTCCVEGCICPASSGSPAEGRS